MSFVGSTLNLPSSDGTFVFNLLSRHSREISIYLLSFDIRPAVGDILQ